MKKKTPSKQFKLTKENYYSPTRPHLSVSQVKDFLTSPELFYKRHVTKELTFSPTPSVRIGKMVDAMVFGEPLPYEVKVLKRDDPEKYAMQIDLPEDVLMTPREYTIAKRIAAKLQDQPLFTDYATRGATFQKLLTSSVDLTPTCGLADVAIADIQFPLVDDLKVVSAAKIASTKAWYYNCLDFGYFIQAGTYRRMLAKELGIDEHVIPCHHLVASEETDGYVRIDYFLLPDNELTQGAEDFERGVREIVDRVAKSVPFADVSITIDYLKPL